MSFWYWLTGAFETAVTWLEAPEQPTAIAADASKVSLVERLAQLILSKNFYLQTKAGGEIHKISLATAITEATALIDASRVHGIPLAILTSLNIGESLGDPLAYDLNVGLAKPNDTPSSVFLRTDFGAFQIDGSTIVALPECKNLTIAQMSSKAYDIAWAANWAAETLAANLKWAMNAVVAEPSLEQRVPAGAILNGVPIDPAWVLAFQAYNVGQTGAFEYAMSEVLVDGKYMIPERVLDQAGKPILGSDGKPKIRYVEPNYSYGLGGIDRYVEFVQVLGQ